MDNEPADEVKEYIDHRVISANEAMAGIFGFDVHRSSPPVMPLRVHLEDEQIAVFEEGDPEAAVLNPKATELTAFFAFNRLPEQQIKEVQDRPRYVDMPLKHVYNSKTGIWRMRKSGQDVIGGSTCQVLLLERWSIFACCSTLMSPEEHNPLKTSSLEERPSRRPAATSASSR